MQNDIVGGGVLDAPCLSRLTAACTMSQCVGADISAPYEGVSDFWGNLQFVIIICSTN